MRDTVNYNFNGEKKIERIINRNVINQYYPSGNLLGIGQIKIKNCENWINKDNDQNKGCSYCLYSKWEIYYNSIVRIKYADVFNDCGKETSCIYYRLNGVINRKETTIGEVQTTKIMDSSGRPAHITENLFVYGDKIIPFESAFSNEKEKVIKNVPGFERYILLNNQLVFIAELILHGLKLLFAGILFRLNYKQPAFNDYTFLSMRLLISGKSAFSFYIRPFNLRYRYFILHHNIFAIALLVILITDILCFKVKNPIPERAHHACRAGFLRLTFQQNYTQNHLVFTEFSL